MSSDSGRSQSADSSATSEVEDEQAVTVKYMHVIADELGHRANPHDTRLEQEEIASEITSILNHCLGEAGIRQHEKMALNEALAVHQKVSIRPLLYGRTEMPSQDDVNQSSFRIGFQSIDAYADAKIAVHFDLDTVGIDTPTLSVLRSAQVAPSLSHSAGHPELLLRERGGIMLRKNADDSICIVPGHPRKERRPGSEARDRHVGVPGDGQGTHYLPWVTYVGNPCNQNNSAIYMYQTHQLDTSTDLSQNAWHLVVAWFFAHTQASPDLHRDNMFSSSVAYQAQGQGVSAFGGKRDGNHMLPQGYSFGSSMEWSRATNIFRDVGEFRRFLNAEDCGNASAEEIAMAMRMLQSVRFYVVIQQTRKGLHPHFVLSGDGRAVDPPPEALAKLLADHLYCLIDSRFVEENPEHEIRMHISIAAEYKAVAQQPCGRYSEYETLSSSSPGGRSALKLMWMKQEVKKALGYGRRDGLAAMRRNMRVYPTSGNLSEHGPANFHTRSNGGLTRQKYEAAMRLGDEYGLIALLVNRDDEVTPQLKMYDTAKRSIPPESLTEEEGHLKLVSKLVSIMTKDISVRRVGIELAGLIERIESDARGYFRNMPRPPPPRLEVVEPKVFKGGPGRSMRNWLEESCKVDFARILNVRVHRMLGVAHAEPMRILNEEFVCTYLKAAVASVEQTISPYGGVSPGSLNVLLGAIATTAFVMDGWGDGHLLETVMRRETPLLLSSARLQGRPTVPISALSASCHSLAGLDQDEDDPRLQGELPEAIWAALVASRLLSRKAGLMGRSHYEAIRFGVQQICVHLKPSSLVSVAARLVATCVACTLANSTVHCSIKCHGFRRVEARRRDLQGVKFTSFLIGPLSTQVDRLTEEEVNEARQRGTLVCFELGDEDDAGGVLQLLRHRNMTRLEEYAKTGVGEGRDPCLSLPDHLDEYLSRLARDIQRRVGRESSEDTDKHDKGIPLAVYGGLLSHLQQNYGVDLSTELFKSVVGMGLLEHASPLGLMPTRQSWERRTAEFVPICYSDAYDCVRQFTKSLNKGDAACSSMRAQRLMGAGVMGNEEAQNTVTRMMRMEETIAHQWVDALCGHILWLFAQRHKKLQAYKGHEFNMTRLEGG